MAKTRAKKVQIPDAPIGDFCLPFARALLAKLVELKRANKLFVKGNHEARRVEKANIRRSELTLLAVSVIRNLEKQLSTEPIIGEKGAEARPKHVTELIDLARQFLAMFK